MAKPRFLFFTGKIKWYFFVSFMVPFRARPALCHVITGISLSCPWFSTCFALAFGNGTIFLDIKLFIKCDRRAVESYIVLGGSLQKVYPNFLLLYWQMWIINSFPGLNEYPTIWWIKSCCFFRENKLSII